MKKFLFIILPLSLLADINIINKEYQISAPVKSWIEFKNENLTRQKYDYSCGAASLSTVLKYYYDQNISEVDVLDAVLKTYYDDNTSDIDSLYSILKHKNVVFNERKLEEEGKGLSFIDLSMYAKNKGFKAIGLALDFESLKKLQLPVILYVKIRKDEHFTVYRGMDSDSIYLSDPSFGNTKIKISKFLEMFYQRDDLKYPGKILAILPTNAIQKEKVNVDFMKIQGSSDMLYEVIKTKLINRSTHKISRGIKFWR